MLKRFSTKFTNSFIQLSLKNLTSWSASWSKNKSRSR